VTSPFASTGHYPRFFTYYGGKFPTRETPIRTLRPSWFAPLVVPSVGRGLRFSHVFSPTRLFWASSGHLFFRMPAPPVARFFPRS